MSEITVTRASWILVYPSIIPDWTPNWEGEPEPIQLVINVHALAEAHEDIGVSVQAAAGGSGAPDSMLAASLSGLNPSAGQLALVVGSGALAGWAVLGASLGGTRLQACGRPGSWCGQGGLQLGVHTG